MWRLGVLNWPRHFSTSQKSFQPTYSSLVKRIIGAAAGYNLASGGMTNVVKGASGSPGGQTEPPSMQLEALAFHGDIMKKSIEKGPAPRC